MDSRMYKNSQNQMSARKKKPERKNLNLKIRTMKFMKQTFKRKNWRKDNYNDIKIPFNINFQRTNN